MKLKNIGKVVSVLAFSALLTLGFTTAAKAGVIEPSGLGDQLLKRYNAGEYAALQKDLDGMLPKEKMVDGKAIQEELDSTGYVKLEEGGVYYLFTAIKAGSNMTLDATGATIFARDVIVNNDPTKTNYQSFDGFKMIGGTYYSLDGEGREGTSIQFAHGNNITLQGMDIKHTNYNGHAIELIACSNVLIENCILNAQGTPSDGSVEEMLQIDVATPKTSPRIYELDSAMANKAACKKVTVRGCEITGNRGLCCNHSVDMETAMHTGIVIESCTITSMSTEALALLNTASAKIQKNKIICKSKDNSSNKSVGINIFNRTGKGLKSIVINNNTIKGKKYAVLAWSENNNQYKKLTMKKNKLYAKNKKDTMSLGNAFKKTALKSNKNYKNKSK
ncbi:MAG: right-handed parallel beta-helix repeat-containing protein [Lachnospiraceae bacterium]|nr:right-handed parallel beta-helix repeat-containing protein [Lachnospiraceae bacterium]